MKKVATYRRMSTDNQKYSLENQQATLQAYADEHDMQIVRSYVDPGKSGLTIKGRPGLQALLRDALEDAAEINAVLVLDVSRWGRFQDTDESAYYEFVLRRSGVDVIYCAEPFENDGSPATTIIKSIKRAMAAEYSRELSVKISAGLRTTASKGFHTGSTAIYAMRRAVLDAAGAPGQVLERGEWKAVKNHKTTLVPGPPSEVGAVRRAFTLFVRGGMEPTEIGRLLTEEGWPEPSPAGWERRVIWSLLRNSKYAGELRFGRTRRDLSRARTQTAAAEWIVVANAYEPIISAEIFRAAEALIERRRFVFNDQEVLTAIAALQSRHGFVSRRLISAQPELPSISAIRTRFGTIASALMLAGCPPMSGAAKRSLSLARSAQSKI